MTESASGYERQDSMSAAEYRSAAEPKPTKYRSKAVMVDGIRFASKAEAARHGQLLLLQRAGEIRELRLQVRHKLVGYRGDAVAVYVSDFDYVTKTGLPVTEDVKGVVTPVFRLKAKLFRQQMGREIQIVRAGR